MSFKWIFFPKNQKNCHLAFSSLRPQITNMAYKLVMCCNGLVCSARRLVWLAAPLSEIVVSHLKMKHVLAKVDKSHFVVSRKSCLKFLISISTCQVQHITLFITKKGLKIKISFFLRETVFSKYLEIYEKLIFLKMSLANFCHNVLQMLHPNRKSWLHL